MVNLNYAGETWKITGTLTDSEGSNIIFTDLVSMSVNIFDERGVSNTYTISDGDIVVGSTTSSYSLEISASDTSNYSEGIIKGMFTFSFPSSDFTGDATDKICVDLLTCSACQ
jgi:hypothetical protein